MTTAEVTLGRVLKIWWFLIWRTVLFSALAGFVLGFLLGIILLFVGLPEQTKQIIAEAAGLLISIPIGIWVLSQIFTKSFSDFRVVLVRKDEDPFTAAGGTTGETQT